MISAEGLSRTYTSRAGSVDAVHEVNLAVDAGQVVGFLGPNGAGKTTTVRMLTTLLDPTAGRATVAGFDVVRQRAEVRRRIGYVSQASSFVPQRIGDELRTQARLHGLSARQAATRTAELAERFDLTGVLDRSALRVSGGQRRRFDLALGLVHRPEVLFLDEPTAGLDPHSRAELWQLLRELRATQGTSVFLTTHYLDEADALCDRVVVINAGRIVADDTSDALKEQLGGDVVVLETDQLGAASAVIAAELPGCAADTAPGRVRFQIDHAQRRLPGLLRELDRAGVALTSVSVKRPTLDDVFLRLTGHATASPLRTEVAA
ncbi:ABC transporter ATP-binding protein [Micromonospora sp. R77]|uniref:ABC transporter ATP-binding protein n=1 Tax=Micromonospora sp. R77 TaxID=2925836 RepID=UPI001F60E869|nr:ABC transporter ATP-binding protein [Micromonospora sp. R77]MCI4061348.1 ABC transporter ATP-binding protein [Micromonospora sp. R77]